MAEIQRGFLGEGLREGILTDGDSLAQGLSHAYGFSFAFQTLLLAKFQLVCKIFAAQPSPKTRHLHGMLVHREEGSWVTSRTNEVLQGRGKNRERK